MNWSYLAVLAVGALLGSVFLGGLTGWAIHRISQRRIPISIADGVGLALIAVGAGFTNEGVGPYPAILIYGLAGFVAYFILQRLRMAEWRVNAAPSPRIEPQLHHAVSTALGSGADPATMPAVTPTPKRADLKWLKRLVGGLLLTVLGAIGATFIFSAVKQVVSPTLFGGSPEFSFLIGAILLILCIFIWRGLIR